MAAARQWNWRGPGPELPADRPRTGVRQHPGAVRRCALPDGLAGDGLIRFFEAGLIALLHRWTGEEALAGDPPFAELLAADVDWAGALVRFCRTLPPELEGELAMAVAGGELSALYAADLFEPATIDGLLSAYAALLAGAKAAPETPISRLPLLTAASHRATLAASRGRALQYDRSRTVPELFAEQARLTPGAPAVRSGGGVMSYGELDALAERIGAWLRRQGAGPGDLVGIHLERSPALIACMLGAWKAGGAYLPLDPAYPVDRLTYMVSQSGARFVLTDAAGAERLAGCGAEVLQLGTLPAGQVADTRVAAPEDLAYVIYTSGSTGQPKGVEIHHGALLNLVQWFRSELDLSPGERFSFVSGLGFDAAVSELWTALTAGAALVLPDEATRLTPSAFRDWLLRERINVAFAPTPMAEALLTIAWPENTPLRRVYAGGDRLRRFPPPGLPFRLENAYGPTECACIATYGPVGPDPGTGTMPDIGRPVAGVSALLLDRHGRLVPRGMPGELCIAGESVGRGYRHRPDLTAERFVETEFGRVYRTGDLARYTTGGALEFLGRLDDQVKIRGFRVELGEIEAALAAHPSVTQAVVTVHEDGRGERRLAACLVPAPGCVCEPAVLRAHLQARLPAYMIPAAFATLPALPLTPNGKVDRKRLPAPDFTALQAEYVGPATEAEATLADLCAEVLGLERVGMADDFFLLGGHSLLATQLLSRLRTATGAEVSIAEFMAEPTLAALARLVAKAGQSSVRIEPDGHGAVAPLSFAQERLRFFDRLEPESPLYNIAEAIRLHGPLDADRLAGALNAVAARHEALRTNFTDTAQVIHPAVVIELPVMDATASEVAGLIRTEAQRPFDLSRDPLLRARLLRLAPDDHLLLLTIHHIISDGWSMGVFYRDVSLAYAGQPLPTVALQYADFAAWQREWLQGGALTDQLAWWRERLAGVPTVLELPADRPRPPVQSFAGARCTRLLPAELMARLQELSRREGATLFMTLLAAYQTLLFRYAGQERFLVGAPIAGRNRQELEGIIGFFVNTLALPADFRSNPTFRAALRNVRELCRGAFAHQDLPFEKLVEELQPDRDRSRAPLIQTLFALQNAPTGELKLPGITVSNPEPTGVDTGTAKYDLIVTVEEAGGEARAVAEFATALYDAETAERLLGHFETLLAAVAADPDQPVGALPLLTAPERQEILIDWNDTSAPVPTERSVPELVADHDPQAIAVMMDGRRLTYGELNGRANALAWRLKALGAGPETAVGVCLERSPELIIALLGVLKAGAAYVAMDPAYPLDRLAFMAKDSGAVTVVTQRSLQGPFMAVPPLCIEDVAGMDDPPPLDAAPEQLAYVIYTSGSTGQPKGVEIRHSGLLNLIWWHRRTYGLTAADRTTQLAGPGFDASVWEIWPTLTAGATLCLPSEETRLSPPLLLDWLMASGTTVTFLPTPLAEAVLALDWPRHHGLRYLLTGGDKLHHYPDRELGCTLVNHYGPTEGTVVATAGVVRPGGQGAPPIGRPIAGTKAYVLDRQLQPVPVGVPGELFIGGAGLARGYRNRPDLTAERFITLPDFGRLYRTGDLVRWLPDGQIEFLGRTDFQVKLRGFRIELGEIESALLRHPAVADAVVLLPEGQHRLVGYIVPRAGTAPVPQQLRAHLAATLPEYMIPGAIVTMERFPLTPNGKVDRRALPAPDPDGESRYEPPATPTEQSLAAIWADVLHVGKVGRTGNFFELGGHSLLATRLINRVRAELGADLPLRAVFEAPVLAELAARIASPMRPTDSIAYPDPADLRDPEIARRWLNRLHELPDEVVAALLERFGAKEDADQ